MFRKEENVDDKKTAQTLQSKIAKIDINAFSGLPTATMSHLFDYISSKVKRYAMIRNRYNQIPHPALKFKKEITKYIN